MPGYWMWETSGVLRPAIEVYLTGAAMTPEQVAIMRAYLRQWIDAPVWDRNPHAAESEGAALAAMRRRIDCLTSRPSIEAWLADAVALGMDPL